MVEYQPQMVSGIHRGDGGGIEYWMEREGKGRERVNWVMKLGISDVSSESYHSRSESSKS
jgi:hypothetical protein